MLSLIFRSEVDVRWILQTIFFLLLPFRVRSGSNHRCYTGGETNTSRSHSVRIEHLDQNHLQVPQTSVVGSHIIRDTNDSKHSHMKLRARMRTGGGRVTVDDYCSHAIHPWRKPSKSYDKESWQLECWQGRSPPFSRGSHLILRSIV